MKKILLIVCLVVVIAVDLITEILLPVMVERDWRKIAKETEKEKTQKAQEV